MTTPAQKLVDTWVAQQVRKVGESADAQRFVATARPARAKKEKPQEKKNNEEEHVVRGDEPNAVLEKGSGYAQRGHDFLAANASAVPNRKVSPAAVYRDFSRDYLEKIAGLLEKHTAFPNGPVANFNPAARSAWGRAAKQSFPYPWEAHHLVPASAFYLKGENDLPAFTDEQMELLKRTEYDVNHGHNIIMLPKLAWGAPVHGLLQHPSDHPEYTKRVIGQLQETAEAIQKKLNQKKACQNLVASFFELLKMIEDDCWNLLVALSRSSVAAACAGTAFDHPHVVRQALTRPTKYQFGRLY